MTTFSKTLHTLRQLMVSTLLVLVCICTVNAYTIVMRGGRRVEIPSEFIVTARTVTYEAGQGIQITLQLAAVDIPATERANNEPAGSFLQRAAMARFVSTDNPAPVSGARRTITNRDLEAAMIRRKQSEISYEKRRQELGLPTVAETRRRAAAESLAFESQLDRNRSSDVSSESYWRSRASALRTEIAATNAQIDYVRSRLEDSSLPGNGTNPFGLYGGSPTFGQPFPNLTDPYGSLGYPAPILAPQLGGRLTFGGGNTRGVLSLNNGGYGYQRFYRNGYPVDPFSTGYYGWQGYDYSYERSALVTHYNQLATQRAGLLARWRELEEEARRAGVPPGWLRP